MADAARISLLAGITTFRDTGGPIQEQLALRADIEAGKLPGPRLFLAGPILHQRDPDKPNIRRDYLVGSPEEAKQVTLDVIGLGVDQVKVYGFWDLDILKVIVDTAHKAGLGVDADVRHINAYRTAIVAGVDRLHHVFTADPLSDYKDEDIRLMVRGIKTRPDRTARQYPAWPVHRTDYRNAQCLRARVCIPGIYRSPPFQGTIF